MGREVDAHAVATKPVAWHMPTNRVANTLEQAILMPGTAFTILRFSAFSQGRYLDVAAAGTLEKALPADERDAIGVKVLKSFDACLEGQLEYGIRFALSSVGTVISQSSAELAKSDVIASLSQTSRIVKTGKAPRRIVLVVSDMLENSSIANSYANNSVRKIAPGDELKAVGRHHLLGDFGGASVFVMGAGLIPEDAVGGAGKNIKIRYRDPKTLAALKQFWSEYFERSNAKLEEFGMPALIVPIR